MTSVKLEQALNHWNGLAMNSQLFVSKMLPVFVYGIKCNTECRFHYCERIWAVFFTQSNIMCPNATLLENYC